MRIVQAHQTEADVHALICRVYHRQPIATLSRVCSGGAFSNPALKAEEAEAARYVNASGADLNMGIEQSSCLGPLVVKLAGEVHLTTPCSFSLPLPQTLAVVHIRASFGEGRSLDDDGAIEIMPQHLVSLRIPQDVSRRNVAVQDARRVNRL